MVPRASLQVPKLGCGQVAVVGGRRNACDILYVRVTGARLNPAVTLASALLQPANFPPRRLPRYRAA